MMERVWVGVGCWLADIGYYISYGNFYYILLEILIHSFNQLKES